MEPELPKTTLIDLPLSTHCRNLALCTLVRCENSPTFSTDEESAHFDGTSYVTIRNVAGKLRLGSNGFTIQFRLRMDEEKSFTILHYEDEDNRYGVRLRHYTRGLIVEFLYRKTGDAKWHVSPILHTLPHPFHACPMF